jgi:hypothetical protein
MNRLRPRLHRRQFLPLVSLLAGGLGIAPAPALPAAPAPPTSLLRPQLVRPLPGGLDGVPMLNDNNPELIRAPGILLSTFDGQGRRQPGAHLNAPLSGPFELFSHHVYAGRPERLDSTLWQALVARPRGTKPVRLRLRAGSTALSQSLDASQPAAPFLPLPERMPLANGPVWSGPGSRVATELLLRQRSPLLPGEWLLPPGSLTTLLVLPLPVRGLDPLLNGRNLQLRLDSDGPLDLASLASFGSDSQPPPAASWAALLDGELSPKEHSPTPAGASGPIIYSRVSGVQRGSAWRAVLTDPGRATLAASQAPISWPISALERGSLGTGQVQTAPLAPFYPGTAWAAHGNYGVEYDLTIPLINDTAAALRLQLALESPLKGDQNLRGLRFLIAPGKAVVFRGSVEVSGLDRDGADTPGAVAGRQAFHLILRSGQQGPALGTVSLAPGERRRLQVRLIYPADATPPQVLSLLPLPLPPAVGASGPMPAVKQSPRPPARLP